MLITITGPHFTSDGVGGYSLVDGPYSVYSSPVDIPKSNASCSRCLACINLQTCPVINGDVETCPRHAQ